MSDKFDALISGYLEGVLTEQELLEFEKSINANPENAKRFADAVYLEQRLTAELRLKRFTDSNAAEPKITEPAAAANPAPAKAEFQTARRRAWMFAALAASLLIAVGIGRSWIPDTGNLPARSVARFASVASTLEASWETGHELTVGDRISSQTLRLETGVVHLAFDSGVEVTLQGPAVFELKSADLTRLHSGVLTCTVPLGAEGFRVDTPTAQVVDLGTAFGIEVRENGPAEVSVFDGEVEIVTDKNRDKHLLTEGKTIQLGSDGSVKTVQFSLSSYEKLWPTASGIAGSTGAFEFAPQWPRMLKRVESDTKIFVLPEGYAKELDQPCPIDMTVDGMAESVIPQGQRVRSFLLQFNPLDSNEKQQRQRKNVRRIEGSITFDRPVIGLIVETETLKKTDRLFDNDRSVRHFGRGLEFKPKRLADEISLSKDRLTLTLNLGVVDRLSDHVRVIVDAQLNNIHITTPLEE